MKSKIRAFLDARPQSDLSRAAFERWLGEPLPLDRDAGAFLIYRGPIDRWPFAFAEVRLGKDGRRVIAVLKPGPEVLVTEKEVDASELGPPVDMAIEPREGAEGSTALKWAFGGQALWFTYTARSRRLLSSSLHWGF